MFARLLAASIFVTLLAPCAASPNRPIQPSFFGINGVTYLHYRDAPDASAIAQRRMDWMTSMGVHADRGDMWWGVVQPDGVTWDWRNTDFLVNFMESNKMPFLGILSYNAPNEPNSPSTDAEIARWADYAARTVGRYKDRVQHWEVWNEPNIPTFWKPEPNVRNYARLLKATYPAAKQANPNATIIGAVTSMTDINWIQGIADNGAINSMDALSFHPYTHADGPEEMDLHRQIQNVRTTLARVGRPTLPIWITEMGWQSHMDRPQSIEEQSRYMVMSYTIAAAEGVERLYWFNLQDWGEHGKIEGWGVVTPENVVKSTAQVYRVMQEQLIGSTFTGYMPVDNGIGYVFQKPDGSRLVVAWADRGTTATFPAGAAKVTAINGSPIAASGTISVGPEPRYIAYSASSPLPRLASTRPARANLLVNPSFEERTTTDPYGLGRGVFYGGETGGEFATITSGAAHGQNAVSITNGTSALWQTWPVPVIPGEEYRLTAKVRGIAATGQNAVQLCFFSGPGWGWKGGPSSPSVQGTTDWQQVSVTATVPNDADVLRINLVSKANTGTIMFDDLQLTRTKEIQPTSTAATSAWLSLPLTRSSAPLENLSRKVAALYIMPRR